MPHPVPQAISFARSPHPDPLTDRRKSFFLPRKTRSISIAYGLNRSPLALAAHGDLGGAQQPRLRVGDDVGGNLLDQRVQAPLAVERLPKGPLAQERQDARRNPAR